MTELPYRENVCILLCNTNRELFLGERCDETGHWQFPQGGVEANFTLEENALREVEEEAGIPRRALKVLGKLNATHQYDFSCPRSYSGTRFRGQSQTFWVVEFMGTDNLIDLKAHGHPEFCNWRWCPSEEVELYVPAFRMKGYAKPISEFQALVANEPRHET